MLRSTVLPHPGVSRCILADVSTSWVARVLPSTEPLHHTRVPRRTDCSLSSDSRRSLAAAPSPYSEIVHGSGVGGWFRCSLAINWGSRPAQCSSRGLQKMAFSFRCCCKSCWRLGLTQPDPTPPSSAFRARKKQPQSKAWPMTICRRTSQQLSYILLRRLSPSLRTLWHAPAFQADPFLPFSPSCSIIQPILC